MNDFTKSRLPAQEVRTIRSRLNLTQRQLAELLHVTPSAVASWEQNRKLCIGPTAILLRIMRPNSGGVVLKELLSRAESMARANAPASEG